MNAYDQVPTAFYSPPRYVPGYLALSSPKFAQPIELEWQQNKNSRSTVHSKNWQPLPTTTSTSTPMNLAEFSLSPRNVNSGDNNEGSTLPLVEHANRAEIHRRQKRVESETSEALKGDIEWVRSGGVLRDGNGRRDFARTKRIRDQLEEQERERKAQTAWAEYEDRWRGSLVVKLGHRKNSSPDAAEDWGIGFRDVAWPVTKPAESPDGLTFGAVKEFVLAPLRGKDVSPSKRKDRIRQLLLRYHPDKTAFLLSRVAEGEKDRVREGINSVFMVLKLLQGDPEIQDSN